jgi:ubiquinone biosynthesis protein
MLFDRTIENIARIRKLIEVLIKYGFGDIVSNTRLYNISGRPKKGALKADAQKFRETRWERIRKVMEELGPTYIKLGQLLSNRPDIVPEPLIEEFEKLLDEVPPFHIDSVKMIIERELGKPLDELFLYFDDKPVGSASIGQVHRARLMSGDDVVVKVQRPNARKQILSDLVLIREFVKLTENYFVKAGILNPLDIVEAFSKSLQTELDYTIEARNLDQFRRLYKGLEMFYVPRSYRDFTTKQVITIEFVSGCKVSDVDTLLSWGLDPKKIARSGLDIYLRQIFELGIFHADPHPGNVLIKPNGAIALIDFGMVGKIMQSQRYAFAGVFISMANRDAKTMAINLRRLAIDHEIDDMRAFEYDLNDLIQDYVVLDLEEMSVRDFTARLQKIAYKYKLQIPGTIFLIFRSIAMLEGMAKSLDKDFDVLESIKPYGLKLLTEQYSLKNVSGEVRHVLIQFFTLFYNFPLEMRDIIKMIRKGRIVFNMQVKNFDLLIRQLHFATNRLVMGLIIAALIIASAIAYSASVGKDVVGILGLPLFSILCWIAATMIAFLLVFNDMRSGRNR